MGEPARVQAGVVKDVPSVQRTKGEEDNVETGAVVLGEMAKEVESSGTENSGQGSEHLADTTAKPWQMQ